MTTIESTELEKTIEVIWKEIDFCKNELKSRGITDITPNFKSNDYLLGRFFGLHVALSRNYDLLCNRK